MAPSNRFDDVLTELAESGDITADALDRIKEASSGSPLRKERDEAIRRAEAAEQQAKTFRGGTIKAQLAKHDLKLNPDRLNVPDDLDVTDEKAFKEFLIDLGAIEDTEQAAIDEELDRAETVAAGAQTGKTARTTGAITPATTSEWSPDKWMRFAKEHPEAAEQLRQGQEVHGIAFA
jgi:hypothetical protein